ncbi:MAG: hypothetical protein KIT80_00095 [Chitinophagaceae bacterium]|nr:hypothetical protein [Chitinophagaceae bacterium]MCW5925290.1 hypothetical protein [Chitinophagaceae bacterium]
MLYRKALLCLIITLVSIRGFGQQPADMDTLIAIPKGLEASMEKKITDLDDKLTRQSGKYLQKLSRREEKIIRQLAKTDSSAAAELLKDSKATYEKLSEGLQTAGNKTERLLSGEYLPMLDSLQGSLGFLKEAKNIVSRSKDIQSRLGANLEQVNRLQNRLSEVSNIQQAVGERQRALQQALSRYTNLPKDISRHLGKYQQEYFYYSQQVREYKELLNDPDKLTRKLLSTLRELPPFQNFLQKHSMLAALFPTPEHYGTPQALAGLQTRADVQQQLLQRLPSGATGGDPAQYLQQQLQQAQEELGKLKDQLNKLGISEGSSDMVMPARSGQPGGPDFTPDKQKTKSFKQRLEYGSNFQTQRANYYFPVTTTIALTAAYRLSDKATAGIGIGGRIGFGDSWQKIRFSSQGANFRTFIDWKAPDLLKTKSRFMASLWFTAGAELNYNRTIESLAVFKNYSNWQKSALAGLTKKFSMTSPVKKGRKVQGNISALYDFLHKQSVPHAPAFVWRVGYGL